MEQKYSVLISVYKKEIPIFLGRCIDSILMQTILPSEILIVKDGELTDELDSMLDEYRKNHSEIKLLSLSNNVGLGKALQIGVLNCSNDLIARMDSDDIAAPGRCELQLMAFSNDQELDVVGGQIIEFETDEPQSQSAEYRSKRKVPLSDPEIRAFAKRRNPFNHMTVMFRKEAVLKAGNYQEMPMFEDYFLWARMLSNGCKMINLDDVLVYARLGNGMYKRRGGLSYVRRMINCQKAFLALGFISLPQYMKNITVRLPVALVPNGMRKMFYNLFLRTSRQ